MLPHDYLWINFWLNLTTLGVLPVLAWIGRVLLRIRDNDIKHLDERFELLRVDIRRLEEKLDRHLEFHSH